MTLLLALMACTSPLLPAPPVPDGLAVGPTAVCEAPQQGFLRSREEAQERGLDWRWQPDPMFANEVWPGGHLVVHDLDNDGDDDVAFANPRGWPDVYVNDGSGHFAAVDLGDDWVQDYIGHISAMAVADLDGDRRPEWLFASPARLSIARNLGGNRWAEPVVVYDNAVDYPVATHSTLVVADLDGDGDLDVVLPGLDQLWSEGQEPFLLSPMLPGSRHVVLRNDTDAWTQTHALAMGSRPGLSLAALATDRDADGDLDLMVLSDRASTGQSEPSVVLRNDGVANDGTVRLVDEAAELGLDLAIEAMGVDAADLNLDGQLDYVISDYRGLRCLMSSDTGVYFDSCAAMGLGVPEPTVAPDIWFGWSIDIADLDNNHVDDLFVSAGVPSLYGSQDFEKPNPDGLWEGLSNGTFVDWSSPTGFADVAHHYGAAAADLDGDGYLEVVVSSTSGPVRLWQNRCGAGHWVEISLAGPEGNSQGFGARVEIDAGGRTQIRELHGLRGMGQGPDRLHFGLGLTDRIDELRVSWPDGAEATYGPMPVDRRFRVPYP